MRISMLGCGTLLLFSLSVQAASFRWAHSSNRIYIEDGGTATLSDVHAALPNAPLVLVDANQGIWLLQANLYIDDGSTLLLHGPDRDGDVGELRLQSNNSSEAGAYVWVMADHGNLDIRGTRITSWDMAANGPDTEYSTYGRAYIRVRSRLISGTPQESRMDVVDSDIGHLGFHSAETYGLSWKVLGSDSNLYELVGVYGDIINSRIHHNYFGVYTYGHQGGVWRGNEVDHNVQYGLDPHDDSDAILIEDNNVHDNGNHGIIASQRCNDLVIRGNRSWANDGNGIMLHRSANDALVENNESYLNADSGIAIFASFGTVIRNNVLLDNGKYGMRFSVGAGDSLVEDNEVAFSGQYGLYFYEGSDAPEAGTDGRPKRNVFRNNHVHGNSQDGIRMKQSLDNSFEDNVFENNGSSFRFIDSSGTRFVGNDIPMASTVRLWGSSTRPSSIYFSRQPFIELKLNDVNSTARFEDFNSAIFEPHESVFTIANGQSSVLDLSPAEIGSHTIVQTRALYAYPGSGEVRVKDVNWGASSRSFRSEISDQQASVNYIVGELVPGQEYVVWEAGTVVGHFTAGSMGEIAFSTAPNTRSILDYLVEPAD